MSARARTNAYRALAWIGCAALVATGLTRGRVWALFGLYACVAGYLIVSTWPEKRA
jgi:hypothetical protein